MISLRCVFWDTLYIFNVGGTNKEIHFVIFMFKYIAKVFPLYWDWIEIPFPHIKPNLWAFVSDGWTKNDLIYIWKGEGALQFANNLSLPGGFKMANHTNKYCDVATATGEYSCLRVDLVFARELSFYIVTIYVPCFMIVVVSWFSFWLDYKAVRLIRQKPPNIVIDIGTNC